jgi:hypothetical protein
MVTNVLKSGFKPLTTKKMGCSSSTNLPMADNSSAHCLATFRYSTHVLIPSCKLCNYHLSWETHDFD